MRIATYNLEFLLDVGESQRGDKKYTFTKDFIKQRISYFATELQKLKADVIFLQEVGSENVLTQIVETSGIPYHVFIATPDNNKVGNAVLFLGEYQCESVPTNTDFPIFIEGDTDTIGPRLRSRRDFITVTGTYLDKPLFIVGLHLKSSWSMPIKDTNGSPKPSTTQADRADGLIRSDVFRLNQAKKVRELVDSYVAKDPNAQVVVAGDFNSTKRESFVRIIQGSPKDARDTLVSVTDDIPEEKCYSIDSSGSGKSLIDHIFISKNLKDQLKSVDIYNEHLYDHGSSPLYPYIVESDHAPVLIELV